jgi:hypothetical protein
MKRKRMSYKKSRRDFRKKSTRMNSINNWTGVRGGIRL